MPTLNEQLHKLCNAKFFTMLDVQFKLKEVKFMGMA